MPTVFAQWIAEGRVQPDWLVWRSDWGEWKTAAEARRRLARSPDSPGLSPALFPQRLPHRRQRKQRQRKRRPLRFLPVRVIPPDGVDRSDNGGRWPWCWASSRWCCWGCSFGWWWGEISQRHLLSPREIFCFWREGEPPHPSNNCFVVEWPRIMLDKFLRRRDQPRKRRKA